MQKINNCKRITCILPEHKCISLLKALRKEKNIIMANKNSARGSSYTSNFAWIEMEVLEVIVTEDRADEIFTYLYEKADINTSHGGVIFQNTLSTSSDYSLDVKLD